MSYYIAPHKEDIKPGAIGVYRVVKRLSDFNPEEDKLYRVFKSRREMDESFFVPCYKGVNGRLQKCKGKFVLRF
tara:strand:+ start:14406 stop:14627 length:222 start_codon:yes stop_codon:yes gene_type:complete